MGVELLAGRFLTTSDNERDAPLALTRGMASLLYGVEPADPAVLLGVGLLQAVVALLATLAPAWRATRVEPNRILRSE